MEGNFANISIHALREEGDPRSRTPKKRAVRFLSTPSARRATVPRCRCDSCLVISIHALREEGDRPLRGACSRRCNFYPRPPRGGRRRNPAPQPRAARFLSTPSARRATDTTSPVDLMPLISIHALCEEGDLFTVAVAAGRDLFLSTPSARRATTCPRPTPTGCRNFYPRPPRGGRRESCRL